MGFVEVGRKILRDTPERIIGHIFPDTNFEVGLFTESNAPKMRSPELQRFDTTADALKCLAVSEFHDSVGGTICSTNNGPYSTYKIVLLSSSHVTDCARVG